MPTNALTSLLADLLRDIQHPHMFWQVLVLAICIALAGIVARTVRGRAVEEDASRAWRVGHGGLKRVVFPLAALLFLFVARAVLQPWLHIHLLTLAMPLLASLAAIRFVFFVLRLTFKPTPWVASFERVFAVVVWLVVVLHITGFLPELIAVLEAVSFPLGRQTLTLWQLLQGLTAVAGALLVSLWLGSMVETRLLATPGLDANLQVVFSRLARAVLVLLAVMISLPWVGIDLTALSVFGGAIGVGLGFGLQKIASNYVAGFIILLDRSIRLGNVISVGTDKGRVTRITTRYTVLRAGNGVEALVPNESLVSGTVQNETYSDSSTRHALAVQISYASNPEQAMALLVKLALAHPHVAKSPTPQAFLRAFADSGINLELQYWLDDPEVSAQQVLSELNLGVWKTFAEAGISIPFPQREVRILDKA